MKFFKYLRYLYNHKRFVMAECFRQKLYWRGLVHDLSKFRPREFVPYMNHFYGVTLPRPKDMPGYYKPAVSGDDAFDFAWLLHQKTNRHHWQWWVYPKDDGGSVVLPMKEPYLTEMLCDWKGAGMAQGKISPPGDPWKEVRKWWEDNNHKMLLHEDTRDEIVRRLYGITN